MPETYDVRGFAPGQVTNADGTETVGIGDSIVLDPNWSSAQDAYTFVFTDSGDGILDGDISNPQTGDDADQFLTVYDENGNVVASGQCYAEDQLSLTGSDGSVVTLYTISIDGVYQGIVANGAMLPGVEYSVDNIAEVGPSATPYYSDLDSQMHGDVDCAMDESAQEAAFHDTMYGDAGNDTISGGSGRDMILAGDGDDQVDGGTGKDTLFGGDGNDTLSGANGCDEIYADGGDDVVEGGNGRDTLYGGAGNDTLIGGLGNDLIAGGTGNDTFVFGNASGIDTIKDFDLADDNRDGFTNDRLDVSGLRDAEGNDVGVWDVTVGDDGYGNAVLTFPNGEAVVLNGISPDSVTSPSQLYAMGVPCFVKGSRIATPRGEIPVETLRAEDLVSCADGSVQPILWAGGRAMDRAALEAMPQLRPVVFRPGALGNEREVRLSPQHAVLVETDEGASLARAVHLARCGDSSIRIAHGARSVSYHHLLLPRHALLWVDGMLAESMWPGPMAMAALGSAAQIEIAVAAPHLIPALNGDAPVEERYGPRAYPLLSGRAVRGLSRIEVPRIHQLQPVY